MFCIMSIANLCYKVSFQNDFIHDVKQLQERGQCEMSRESERPESGASPHVI